MESNIDARLTAIEKKLDETLSLISKMRRAQKTASAMRLLYWAVIIGLGIASIYLIQPYIGQLGAAYGIGSSDTESGSTGVNYSEILKQLKEYQANQ